MKRWWRWTISVAALLALCLSLASALLERSARRAATRNGAFKDFHEVTAQQLDREVRSRLPIGTSRAEAEQYLRKERMQFSFDPDAAAIFASAPYVKGSNFLVRSSLGFTVHLDNLSRVKSIDSKAGLTGP